MTAKATKQSEAEMKSVLDESTSQKQSVAIVTPETLKADVNIGMGKVDPMDIRPPQILLIQKSSNIDQFSNQAGEHPSVGQFFHNGKLEIHDFFECYFIFAAKTNYVDKKYPDKGERPQYKAVGVWVDDMSIFGMTFRSSALFALSPLFTAVVANKRPMYSIRVAMETKELTNTKGTWTIPTLKIVAMENDPDKLSQLQKLALQFDKRADEAIKDIEADEIPE